MEEPPDIRKRNRKETLSDLMIALKISRSTKTASSGMERLSNNDWAAALEDFRESQELYEELGDLPQASNMLSMQSLCLYALNKLDEAAEAMRHAIALKGDGCQPEGKATDLLGLGEILLKKKDFEGAQASFEEAANILRELGLENDVKLAEIAIEKVKKVKGIAN